MIVMIPLIQLLLFGYAINTNVRNVPTAIVDQSHSATGRMLVESIKATQVVDVKRVMPHLSKGNGLLMDLMH